jgi:hypothetical protein
MGKVFGREPAMWLALLGAAWQIVSAFGLNFDAQTQSVVTAVVAAVLGVVVAVRVHDGIVAAVNGFVIAGVSAVSYYCMHWTAEHQSELVGAIMIVYTFFATRQNVTPPTQASVSPAGKLVA